MCHLSNEQGARVSQPGARTCQQADLELLGILSLWKTAFFFTFAFLVGTFSWRSVLFHRSKGRAVESPLATILGPTIWGKKTLSQTAKHVRFLTSKVNFLSLVGDGGRVRCGNHLPPPQIHQKYRCMCNCSYRTPPEGWQKTSDFQKDRPTSI